MKRFVFTLFSVAVLLAAITLAPAQDRSARVSTHHSPAADSTAMPDPQTTLRQQIADEFIRRIKTIDSAANPLANGYRFQTDIGKNGTDIERWRTNYNQDELKAAHGKAIPAVFDLVRTREKEFPDQVTVVGTLPVQVRIFHFKEGVTAAELTKMLADVQQAVVTNPATGKRDLTLGGLAIDVRPSDDGFVIPTETFTIEAGAVGFDVDHHIEPYGQ